MAVISPAVAQRRLAYDIIHDYIVKILDKSTPLYRREALAESIPTITLAIMQRLRRDRLRETVRKILKLFGTVYKLKIPDLGERESIEEWYVKCVERGDSSHEEWMMRVALCSLAILSHACVEEVEIIETVQEEAID